MRNAVRTLLAVAFAALFFAGFVHVAGAVPDASGGTSRASSARIPLQVLPGEWIVSFDARIDGVSRRRLKRAGVRVERVSRDGLRAVVASDTVPFGLEQKLAGVKGVQWAEPVRFVYAAYTPSDFFFQMQWGLHSIEATRAWDTTMGTPAVKIAIVDSGIDLTHPEFAGRVTGGLDSAGYDFVNDDHYAQDDTSGGHGTHVAGIAVAVSENETGGVGVAPMCSVIPVKVLGSNGSGLNYDIGEGIKWAADQGADVINLSLESPYYDVSIASRVAYAQAADALVVAAAGNHFGAPVAYPARLAGVVGVSAVTTAHAIADFSNRGPEIDLAAPGDAIVSVRLGGGSTTMNGTSMAAPFVAGTAALVRGVNPDLTQSEVASRLMASATDLGVAGHDSLFGAGLLNASRALTYATWDSDDDIPGTSASSPATGTLSSIEDTHDVYAVALVAGETLEATLTLTADAGTDFRLHVFGPNAQRVAGADAPLSTAGGDGYPMTVDLVATESGVYYLDIAAESGDDEYALEWAVIPVDPSDDEIPGVALPVSPVVGTLAQGVDDNDVFSIYLGEGQKFTASLNGSSGTDFDLRLFGPGAATVNSSTGRVALSEYASYPDAFTYVATVSGTYYLNPYAYTGSGAYMLSWTIAQDPDDDIPGVAIPASPVNGSVSVSSDPDDVYRLDLDRGQELTVTLDGAEGAETDFDLYLWGPDAQHIAPPDMPVAESTSIESTEQVIFTAPVAGRYYVHVHAFQGSGTYRLSWLRGGGPADDDIPGVPAPPSPVAGALGVAGDLNDVFAVSLSEGQQVQASLEASPGAEFDLRLFGPGASSVHTTDAVVASYWRGSPERITFVAPETGTYYLNARRASGVGLYALDYAIGSATTSATALDVSAARVGDGSLVSLAATLTSGAGSEPVTGAPVAFEAYDGESWQFVDSAVTDASGTATTTVVAGATLRFRARHSGDDLTAGVTSEPADIFERSASTVTLSRSSTRPSYMAYFTLTARAVDASSGAVLDGVVGIEILSGSDWLPVSSSVVSTGVVKATLRLKSAATYRAVFGGSVTHEPNASFPALVKPRASVGTPKAPTTMSRYRYYTVYGYLKPRHTSGTKPVKIKCYRKNSAGVYRYHHTVYAKVSNYSSYSKYKASVRLPHSGRWRLRGYAPADSGHSSTWSHRYDYVTVR